MPLVQQTLIKYYAKLIRRDNGYPMKDKIMYIAAHQKNINDETSGIQKKIKSQIKVFERWGYNVEPIHANTTSNLLYKVLVTFFAFYFVYKKTKNEINEQIKLTYIRYENPDLFLLKFLKNISKRSESKIVLEIPTYPYDKERISRIMGNGHLSLKNIIINIYFYINDAIIRRLLKKYVDYIYTFSDDKQIFGIDAINSSNGIDVEMLPISSSHFDGKILNIIGVATLNREHGYDRVINGIYHYKKYKGPIGIMFHVVGDGQQRKELEKLSSDLKIENCIHFYGAKSRRDLDVLFDKADIGVSSLGRHRQNIFKMTDLKSREYCGRGLPFISSIIDKDFSKQPFQFCIKPDESYINFKELIEHYENYIKNNKNFKMSIRKFAEENITWEKKMEAINHILMEQSERDVYHTGRTNTD
ncbi:glycosyltransferase [Sporolactobacillus spathodeae]|uniref:Glycosyl transferase family 1 domain-containing protein n=1 Tax=Sporolactobacillus spathodeae TaxID=1465502 RepID=A0ABS2Q8X8_9BACL|nr:glycosyltransferase [Sporolactobacillus spathodeae]MBM7657785.1 hypothetical protein [Sporolactobacillus spathodeae]